MTISSPAQASNMQQLQETRNVGTDFITSWILWVLKKAVVTIYSLELDGPA